MMLSNNIRFKTSPAVRTARNPEHMHTGAVEALHTLLRPEMQPAVEVWMRTASEEQKRGILRLARQANPQGFSGVQAFQRQLPSLLRRIGGESGGNIVDLPYQRDRLDERKAMWEQCDPNGNGYCSFAEVDAFFRYNCGFGENEKMKMLHAFNACRNIGGQETGHAADYVEKKEFRKFLQTFYRNLGGIVEEQAPVSPVILKQMMRSAPAAKGPLKSIKGADLPFQREREAERNKLFSECDPNGNRYASFAEIDAIFRKRYGFGEKEKMPMLRAYDACKNIGGQEAGYAADYIEHKEFRKFLELVLKNLKDAAIQEMSITGGMPKSASAPKM